MSTALAERNHSPESDLPIVDINYAGGTISSVMTDEGYRVGGHSFHLTSMMGDLPMNVEQTDSIVYQVGNQAVPYDGLSENETPDDQIRITTAIFNSINRGRNSVTTHGTDSLEQMAKYAEGAVGALARERDVKVILTGANEDMVHPQTDVWENLNFALEMAVSDAPAGVYVAYHGKLIPAADVAKLPYLPKSRPTFASKHSPEYREALTRRQTLITKQNALLFAKYKKTPKDIQDVNTVVPYAVNQIRMKHDNFINDLLANPHIDTVLLTLYHSGTANTGRPQQSVSELVKALRETRENLVFFAVTETGEPVDLHAYETSVKLREAGVVPLYDMYFDVAYNKLRLLKPGLSPTKRIEEMMKSKAGEISRTMVASHAQDIQDLIRLYEQQ